MKLISFLKRIGSNKGLKGRCSARVSASFRLSYQGADGVLRSNCCVKDISTKGLRLSLFQILAPGASLKLCMEFKDYEKPSWAIGKVAWFKETPGKEFPYEAGIEISIMDESLRSHIQDYLKTPLPHLS